MRGPGCGGTQGGNGAERGSRGRPRHRHVPAHAVALPDKEALFAPEGLLAGCLQSDIVRAHADVDALLLRGRSGSRKIWRWRRALLCLRASFLATRPLS